MNHPPQAVNRTFSKGKSLLGLCLLAVFLMSCNQNPAATTTSVSDSGQFTLALQGEQAPTLQSQAVGGALPNGNYLCVERIRNGKALGLILQGNIYQVAMSYNNGHFFNWQEGQYSYTVTYANPRFTEQWLASRGGVIFKDLGSVQWLSGPMTAWYNLDNNRNIPVVFSGRTDARITRRGDYSYERKDEGTFSFRVWDTDVDCSEVNFQIFGGVW
jgi:hypothetical protein